MDLKMKLVLLLLVGYLGITAEGQKCLTRSEKKSVRRMTTDMSCHEPTDQLVKLPVPEGYDYVMPSMGLAKQCGGRICHGMNKGCKATSTKPKNFTVEAMMMNGVTAKCFKVQVNEHISCGCGCTISEDQCTRDQVFDQRRCSCVCSEEAKARCNSWDGSRMWTEETCSCHCTQMQRCPVGASWIEQTCSCMRPMQGD